MFAHRNHSTFLYPSFPMATVGTAVDVPIEVSATSTTLKETSTADAEVLNKVAERLRFFFSDANIRQDAFMRRYLLVSSSKETPNDTDNKYSVPISALLKCHTIQRITTSPDVIVQAAETHLNEELVVVKATGEKKEVSLKRRISFTKDLLSGHISLSLYVSSLPLTADRMKYAVSVADIRQLFADDDAIALVKLKFRPRSAGSNDPNDDGEEEPTSSSARPKWIPSGGAMVEFKTIEALQKAASTTLTMKDGVSVSPEHPLTLGDGGEPLQVMLLSEYKDRSEKTTAVKKENDTGVSQEKSDPVPEDASSPVFTMDWKPGCVIVLEGMSNAATTNDSEDPGIDCDREAILETVAQGLKMTVDAMKEQKMVYVDYSRGQTKGAIRFSEPSEQVAAICQSLHDKSLTISNVTIMSVRVLSGTEEQEYWDRFIQFKNQQKQNHLQEKNSKRKGPHGGHHGKRSKRRY
jgi:RNA binding motif